MYELEAHADFVHLAEQYQTEIQQMSDSDILDALRRVNGKLVRCYEDREGRLAAWQEEIPLKRELQRRHPVAIPPDILKETLSRYHVFVATAGQERLVAELRSRKLQAHYAQTVLAVQRATTPETKDAAERRMLPGARRIWLSMQPEYDGSLDPDPGPMARGWIERVDGSIIEGMFDGNRPHAGLMFTVVGGQPPISLIPWSDVHWVRLESRSELPTGVLKEHAELLANKWCTDHNVVMGFISGPSGAGETDAFVLVPIVVPPTKRSAEDWIGIFERAGIEIRPKVTTFTMADAVVQANASTWTKTTPGDWTNEGGARIHSFGGQFFGLYLPDREQHITCGTLAHAQGLSAMLDEHEGDTMHEHGALS